MAAETIHDLPAKIFVTTYVLTTRQKPCICGN
nr:MAG TPA: hypothetical protein [Caudoviricetes sp.]